MPRAFLFTSKKYCFNRTKVLPSETLTAIPQDDLEPPDAVQEYSQSKEEPTPDATEALFLLTFKPPSPVASDSLLPEPSSPASSEKDCQSSNVSCSLTSKDPDETPEGFPASAAKKSRKKPRTSKIVYSESGDEVQEDHNAAYKCPECGKCYTTASNLTRHRQTHRSISDKKAKQCPYCERIYVSSPAYNMHIQTHLQACECPVCNKKFSRQWLLQGHLRTHTGERPYSCPKCRKTFADKSNLRAHVQTHSTEKTHICDSCGKAFALRSYLMKHKEASCSKTPSILK